MSNETNPFRVARVRSPLGRLFVVCDAEDRLRALDFEEHEPRLRRLLHAQYGGRCDALVAGVAPRAVAEALDAYFAGRLDALDALETRTGGTPFQRQVWRALRRIPAVVLTSSRRASDRERSFALGADDFIEKPMGFDAFVEAIGAVIRRWAPSA